MDWGHGKIQVFLISGRIDSGKSTVAEMLLEILKGRGKRLVYLDHFASGVKLCASEYFNWNRLKDEKGRRLLQNIGNFGREYNPTIWVEKLYKAITVFPPNYLIIDDWRYPNEYEYLRDAPLVSPNIQRWRVEAPGREVVMRVPGEDTLVGYTGFDYVIQNVGSLEELYCKAEQGLDGVGLGVSNKE